MCELPARSMPGSEMLLVLKTRIRGANAWSSGTVSVGHRHFIFLTKSRM